jgi:2-phospho-L-lactate guanylyltransferase (CobY/MobA/RfbA family)
MNLEGMFFSKTAILLFAQSEFRESVSKPITGLNSQDVGLWKKMNERVLKTIKRTKLPFYISDEDRQIGKTFGDKLTGAIHKVFAKGYDNVIVVGNDCPSLNYKHLLEAFVKLKTNDSVLGADFNGGVYLIGVSKVAFNTKTFSAVSWQTPKVFNELRLYFNHHSCFFLPRLNDFNRSSDLKDALKSLSFSDNFRSLLMSLNQEVTVSINRESFLVSSELIAFNHNKGSPLSFFNFI